ncbi:SDR family oxidoreductase [Klebsiella variicola subsp. variicola]|nr:SDR family oxidoreductase [Klebsiella variicola subsp. variicola]
MADASDITSIAELIREVEVETGGVDVLHFNAAAMHDGNLDTQSVAGFIEDLTTNIGAVYAAIKAVTPRMAARGEGAILLTGGMFATQPHPEYLTLSIGKAGLLNLTHGLFPGIESAKYSSFHRDGGGLRHAGFRRSPGELPDLFWQQYRQPSAQWTAEAFYPVPHHQ